MEESWDLVHAVNADVSTSAAAIARALDIPATCMVHDPDEQERGMVAGGTWRAVMTPSESLRQNVVNRSKVDKDVVTVVPYGLDLSGYRVPQRSVATTIPVIGMIGPLTQGKSADTFLKGAAELSKRNMDTELLVVGDGPQEGPLRRLADQLGLRKRVTFYPGGTPPAEAIFTMDVFVQHNAKEALSIELIEALACGRPIVASASGGAQEVLRDEVTGMLVRPGDPAVLADRIERLLTDSELRSEMSMAARERAEQAHGLSVMIDGTEAVFEKARNGRGSNGNS